MSELITEIKAQLAEAQKTWLAEGAEQNSNILKSIADLTAELADLKANATKPTTTEQKTIGQRFIENENVKLVGKSLNKAVVNVGDLINKTAITSSTSAIPAQHIGHYVAPFYPTNVRSLIPSYPATSGSFSFAQGTFTNAANAQGGGTSPLTVENYAKAESTLAFTQVDGKIVTIAHLLPASKQALDDLAQLSAIIDNQLLSGLRAKEESQILTGTGTGGYMNGLITQATAKDSGLDPSSPNKLDKLRMALLQVQLTGHLPTGIVMNPTDFAQIETLKASTAGTYLVGNPQGTAAKLLWGFPVVESLAVTAGTYLVGAFATACGLYDKQDATIDVSDSHSDWFAKNMIAVRGELRTGLAVMFPGAFVTGSF